MKEDLAEWLNRLYTDLDLNPENFFSQLETGAIICRHSNNVTRMGRDAMLEQTITNESSIETSLNELDNYNQHMNSPSPDYDDDYRQESYQTRQPTTSSSMSKASSLATTTSINHQPPSTRSSVSDSSPKADRSINWFRVKMIPYKMDARPGTFFARDNICQFILWCRSLNIRECLLFETDDLVARKNEKSFILCLLEVARIGFKVGMPTPLIIQLEQEIDREIENDAKLQKQLEEEEEEERGRNQGTNDNDDQVQLHAGHEDANNNGNSLTAKTMFGYHHHQQQRRQVNDKQEEADDVLSQLNGNKTPKEKEQEEEVEYCEDIGPKPQVITNDLLSLHEKVNVSSFNSFDARVASKSRS